MSEYYSSRKVQVTREGLGGQAGEHQPAGPPLLLQFSSSGAGSSVVGVSDNASSAWQVFRQARRGFAGTQPLDFIATDLLNGGGIAAAHLNQNQFKTGNTVCYGHRPSSLNPWSLGPIVGTVQVVPFNSYADPFGYEPALEFPRHFISPVAGLPGISIKAY